MIEQLTKLEVSFEKIRKSHKWLLMCPSYDLGLLAPVCWACADDELSWRLASREIDICAKFYPAGLNYPIPFALFILASLSKKLLSFAYWFWFWELTWLWFL